MKTIFAELDKLIESKNLDIYLLRSENERLKAENEQLKEDIEKYKENEERGEQKLLEKIEEIIR